MADIALEQLIPRAVHGDPYARSKLAAIMLDIVENHALLAGFPRFAVMEIAAEVALPAIERLPTLRNAAAFHSWLWPFVYAAKCRYLRRQERERKTIEFSLDDVSADRRRLPECRTIDPYECAVKLERLEAIHQALTALPRTCREVLVLTAIHGLTHEEVAQRLKISPAASRQRASRAMRMLRTLVGDAGDSPRQSWTTRKPLASRPRHAAGRKGMFANGSP